MTEPKIKSVTFQKGTRVGARSFRYVYLEGEKAELSEAESIKAAKAEFPTWKSEGYRVTEVREF